MESRTLWGASLWFKIAFKLCGQASVGASNGDQVSNSQVDGAHAVFPPCHHENLFVDIDLN